MLLLLKKNILLVNNIFEWNTKQQKRETMLVSILISLAETLNLDPKKRDAKPVQEAQKKVFRVLDPEQCSSPR